MTSSSVAILDSGIGGLPYLSWVQSNLPTETLVYVADSAQFPYGEKSPEAVREAVLALGRAIVSRFDPKLLLVACNTASVLGLDALRQGLSIPVVGVVPAVKTAAQFGNGVLGVLATPRTVQHDYWENLGREFAPGRVVKGYAAPDLVSLVEEGGDRQPGLKRWAERLRADGVDSLVLGCTHYLHLAEELKELLGPHIRVVDSRDGVGKRVEQVLSENRLLASSRSGENQFFFTLDPSWSADHVGKLDARYRGWASRFHLGFGGGWSIHQTAVFP